MHCHYTTLPNHQTPITKMSHLHSNVNTIKNGYKAQKSSVTLFSSKKSKQFLQQLHAHGFIKSWCQKNKKEVVVHLKYIKNIPALQSCPMISKPSNQVRLSFHDLVKIKNISGILILETVYGFMHHNQALNHKVGGKIVAHLR